MSSWEQAGNYLYFSYSYYPYYASAISSHIYIANGLF